MAPLHPNIPLATRTPEFSLFDLGDVLARRQQLQGGQQQLQGGQLALDAARRQQEEDAALRAAYSAQYGSGGQGLAAQVPQGYPPAGAVQELPLGGGPTAAFPTAVPRGLAGVRPGQPAPHGLAAMGPQMGHAPGQEPDQERQFIRQLYAISPKAGRDAERHAFERQQLELDSNLARVKYLGQISRGVLDSNTQQAWDVGRRMLLEAGMSERDAPAVYDPQLVRLYANTAEDAATRLAQGKLAIEQAQLQRERAKAPDYGYGDDLNAALYATYGPQIPPGGPPTPAMVAGVRAQEAQRVQQGKLAVAGATGVQAAEIARTGQPLEGEAAKAVSDLTALHTMADDIASLYKDDYTGPIVGRTGRGREITGWIDDQEVALRRTVQDVNDILARLRTGAAFPASEVQRLDRLAPNLNDPPNVFKAKLQNFTRALETMRDARLRTATTGRQQLREETTPTTPLPGAARQPTDKKAVTAAEIAQVARQSGLSEADVRSRLQGQGYRLEGQ